MFLNLYLTVLNRGKLVDASASGWDDDDSGGVKGNCLI